jgi:hypothetical protein
MVARICSFVKESRSFDKPLNQPFRILDEKLSNHGLSLKIWWGEEGRRLKAGNRTFQNFGQM